jgi:hypothetical protein
MWILGFCHAFLLSTAGMGGLEQNTIPSGLELFSLYAEQFQPNHTSDRKQESMTKLRDAHTAL